MSLIGRHCRSIAVDICVSHIITNIYKILLCTRREERKLEQLGLEQVPEVENHLSQFPGTFCWLPASFSVPHSWYTHNTPARTAPQ